jgi:gas vesicle protein
VTERNAIVLSALAGAVIGGCAGYLLLTEKGRQVREELEPKLMALVNEFEKARSAVQSVKADVRQFGR